jgi:hypothetical protein
MVIETLRVPPRAIFAAVVLDAREHPPSKDRQDWPTLGDLTQKIIELKRKHNLDTSDISIRADKGGWISDDLSSFVNRFVLFGLASPNPVRLLPPAVERCKGVIAKVWQEQPKDIDRLVSLLDLGSLFTESTTAPSAATGSRA